MSAGLHDEGRGLARSPRWGLSRSLAAVVLVAGALLGCDGGEVSIDRIDPRVGHTQGEQPVRIHGSNFRTDIGYTVHFGNKKATSVTIQDPQTIVVTTPARDQAGDVDVTIRADDGQAFRIVKGFRYENMGGSVVEGLGQPGAQKKGDSKLAY